MKVFVDTNVWFSAIYKGGIPQKAVLECYQRGEEIVISYQVLEEIFLVVEKKYPKGLNLVQQLFSQVHPTVLKNPTLDIVSRYFSLAANEDLPLLAAAIEYGCDFFLTGNLKDFKVRKIRKRYKLFVCAPKEFLNRLFAARRE